jgi:hypothetical protein
MLFALGQPKPAHSQTGSHRLASLQIVQRPPAKLSSPAVTQSEQQSQPAAKSDPSALQNPSRQARTNRPTEGQWTAVDAGDISISYPDAPLPDGWLLLRIAVQLDAQGHFASLHSAADSASEAEKQVQTAFIEAVAAGLATTDFPLTRLRTQTRAQRFQPSTLCLEVLFDERDPVVRLSWLSTPQTTTPPCQPRRRRSQS